MKALNSLVALSVLLGGTEIVLTEAWPKDGVINVVKAGESNYCQMHFPAIDERSLFSDRPVLKDANSGDIIHFYGPCDFDPHGKEAAQAQRRDAQRRFQREYNH